MATSQALRRTLRRKELEELIAKTKRIKQIGITIGPSELRILKKALNVHKDATTLAGLLRAILLDWDHLRRELIYYKSIEGPLLRAINDLKKEIEELKRENREIKKLLAEYISSKGRR